MKITIFNASQFRRLMSTLLRFLKYTVFFVIFVLVVSTIGWDLERGDGGYLRPIFYWIFSYFVSVCEEIVEICETPFASLSIAKIFRLVWHLCVSGFILFFGRVIWLIIQDLLEIHREKQEE